MKGFSLHTTESNQENECSMINENVNDINKKDENLFKMINVYVKLISFFQSIEKICPREGALEATCLSLLNLINFKLLIKNMISILLEVTKFPIYVVFVSLFFNKLFAFLIIIMSLTYYIIYYLYLNNKNINNKFYISYNNKTFKKMYIHMIG